MKRPSFLSVVFTLLFPAFAQAQVPLPTPRPVFTPALRARLRSQIIALAPQLHLDYVSSSFDGLALSAARVGDFDLALRLAKTSSQCDGVWQWRALQLSNAGKDDEAIKVASHVSHVLIRAEALLFMAQMAVRAGRVPGAVRALSQFSNLGDGPYPHEIAYGGYLWARVGQPDAARRLWKRAQPLSPDKAQGERPVAMRPPVDLVPVIAQTGMMSDVLSYLPTDLQADNFSHWSQATAAARTPAQRQVLRDWLAVHNDPQNSPAWKILALIEASYGSSQTAHEDYARAIPQTKVPPPAGVNDALSDLVLANVWNDEPMRLAAEARLRAQMRGDEWAGIEMMIVAYRLFSLQGGQLKVRPNISREELIKATDELVAMKTNGSGISILTVLATEWHKRGDNEQLARLARTIVEAGRANTQQENSRRTREEDTFWFGGDELQGAQWLRLAGRNDEAQSVANQFAREMPSRLRLHAVMALWKAGFPQVGDALFDPVTELKSPRALQKRRDMFAYWPVWEELAATQARFVSPDAPAKWFERLPSPNTKGRVLSAWIEALSPEWSGSARYFDVSSIS